MFCLPYCLRMECGNLTLAITGEPAKVMITGSLIASLVQGFVRPPQRSGLSRLFMDKGLGSEARS